MREHLVLIVERLVFALMGSATAQQIDELVFCDRIHPRRQWLPRIVSMALVMHGEQRFLHEILHFIRETEQPLAEVAAQIRAEMPEKRLVRGGIAREAA